MIDFRTQFPTYHYCPSFLLNVIFIGLLAEDDFNFLIKDVFDDIFMNNIIIMHGQLRYGIYLLSQPISVIYISNKYPKVDYVINAYL